jgi:septum formation protein
MLYLASRSPRRRELLGLLGITPGLLDVDVPEVRQTGEPPADYVNRVAREKAGAGLLEVLGAPDALVLGADTEVVLGDTVYGKPANADDAARMLRSLAGRTHEVITVVWLLSAGREAHAVSTTSLRFAALDDAEIAAYVAGGEWAGKAGAYAIQGAAAAFVERLDGSHSGVMGLPLRETYELLKSFGMHALSAPAQPALQGPAPAQPGLDGPAPAQPALQGSAAPQGTPAASAPHAAAPPAAAAASGTAR